jgi:predicted transcriptional regulator
MKVNGSQLTKAMQRMRLSQKLVAAGVGVSRIAVYAWQNNLADPSEENFGKLVAYLRRFEPRFKASEIKREN